MSLSKHHLSLVVVKNEIEMEIKLESHDERIKRENSDSGEIITLVYELRALSSTRLELYCRALTVSLLCLAVDFVIMRIVLCYVVCIKVARDLARRHGGR